MIEVSFKEKKKNENDKRLTFTPGASTNAPSTLAFIYGRGANTAVFAPCVRTPTKFDGLLPRKDARRWREGTRWRISPRHPSTKGKKRHTHNLLDNHETLTFSPPTPKNVDVTLAHASVKVTGPVTGRPRSYSSTVLLDPFPSKTISNSLGLVSANRPECWRKEGTRPDLTSTQTTAVCLLNTPNSLPLPRTKKNGAGLFMPDLSEDKGQTKLVSPLCPRRRKNPPLG